MSNSTILVVEDDRSLREALVDTLEFSGYQVEAAHDGCMALEMIDNDEIAMVVSDIQMPEMDGMSLLRKVKAKRPDMPVILMTAYGTIEDAVSAMRVGAADYLVKPFEADALVEMVARFVSIAHCDESSGDYIAEDSRSRDMLELARRVAGSDVSVMITGKSGTGKEVLARFIHHNSNSAKGPFIAINCAAIPENMLEAMLFGYEKGAFTGAYRATPGKFEMAQGGTLLLDEVSEMPLALQAKLLRVLQEREVERVGGHRIIPLNVRVLATSNRNLREEVAAGRFREDLFYRLNVFPLHLHPLSRRPDDIVPLTELFVRKYSLDSGNVPALSYGARARLTAYPWPGNVRELENVVQRALIMTIGGEIQGEDLHFEVDNELPGQGEAIAQISGSEPEPASKLNEDLKTREQRLIVDALRNGNGNRTRAAEELGISPRTLRYKLARLREAGVELPV
ncbi:sigma-54-dependent Fis family transcriptional regulator [Solemya pervernicosa gill symbiont]|uniref:Sigma-54-dependent Fis family transcriptional regulator n=1 Tax=Solemya pervernicosa gill symbiont TaxID=642797 RepID=A0A1T2LAU1_9GAMM|nr:sigma-54 dependent transcriptional regulator [Solemya pervernicosa gill symbiont]OOZ42122.1 sigma-54-dependent Fis family transcriptional regulator [Solemya pervernicosa gill symbiont]